MPRPWWLSLSVERPVDLPRRAAAPAPAHLAIRLRREDRDHLLSQARSAAPLEACGLLLGWRDGPRAGIDELVTTANSLASTERYEIDPERVLAADRAARQSGRVLLGAWHSHPRGRAVPSAVDRAEAWPDWCYLIVGLGTPDTPELRAWRLLGEDFTEDVLEIE